MPDTKISAMDPAGALTGAELVPAVQGGANVRTTLADIVAYGNALITLSSLGVSANGITLIGHTFAQMRADLDLEIGVDVQAYSANLTTYAAVTPSVNAQTLLGHTFAQMRADLDLEAGTDFYSIAAADSAIATGATSAVNTHVGLSDPHTQYLLESAVSANGLTLIGHTFAQMRADLDLEIGTDVQAYDADTAKTDVVQAWTAAQTLTLTSAGAATTPVVLRNASTTTNTEVVLQFNASASTARYAEIASKNDGSNNNSLIFRTGAGGALTDALTLSGAGTATFAGFASFASDINLSSGSDQYIYYDGALHVAKNGTGDAIYIDSSRNIRVYGNFAWGTSAQGTLTYAGSDAYIDSSGSIYLRPGSVETLRLTTTANINAVPNRLPSYTVAGLPAGSSGDTAYASNGRKNGEGGGAGTGVMVFKDGTAWRACDTGATVAA